MANLQRRIERLERPDGASKQAGLQLILMQAGATLAMDIDRCVEVLAESGSVRPGSCVLDFLNIPHGLTAPELERAAEVQKSGGRK